MKAIWIIAKNTYREIIRDRILYSLIAFTFLIMGLSLALGQLSFAEQTRISIDFGFAAINLSTVILSIFVGSTLVSREIEKRTVLTLLARPITRSQFLIGKFIGLSLVILTVAAGFSLAMGGVLYGYGVAWSFDCTVALVGVFLEAEILLGLTMLFGVLSKPTMTVIFSIGFFLIGHWLDNMMFFAKKSESQIFKVFSYVCHHLLPNLERFNWRSYATSDLSIASSIFWQSLLHAGCWVVFLLTLTCFIFRRKDFV